LLAIVTPIAAGVVVVGLIGFAIYRVVKLIAGLQQKQQS
jgi:preprotein translocase subunit Sss1